MSKNSLPPAEVLKRTFIVKASLSNFAMGFIQLISDSFETASEEEVRNIGKLLDMTVLDIKSHLNFSVRRSEDESDTLPSSQVQPKEDSERKLPEKRIVCHDKSKAPPQGVVDDFVANKILGWTTRWMAYQLEIDLTVFSLPTICRARALWIAVDCRRIDQCLSYKNFIYRLARDDTIKIYTESDRNQKPNHQQSKPKVKKPKFQPAVMWQELEEEKKNNAKVEQFGSDSTHPGGLAEGLREVVGPYIENFSKWAKGDDEISVLVGSKSRIKNLRRTAQGTGKKWRDFMVALKGFPTNPLHEETVITGNLLVGQFANQLNALRALQMQLNKLRLNGSKYVPVVASLMPYNEPPVFATVWKNCGGRMDEPTTERPWQAFQMCDPSNPSNSWDSNENMTKPVPQVVWKQWKHRNPGLPWLSGYVIVEKRGKRDLHRINNWSQ